ncbi:MULTISPECIES: hypothetical protein [unclassified Nonomuraea]
MVVQRRVPVVIATTAVGPAAAALSLGALAISYAAVPRRELVTAG